MRSVGDLYLTMSDKKKEHTNIDYCYCYLFTNINIWY